MKNGYFIIIYSLGYFIIFLAYILYSMLVTYTYKIALLLQITIISALHLTVSDSVRSNYIVCGSNAFSSTIALLTYKSHRGNRRRRI